MGFDPIRQTFNDCLVRIEKVAKEVGLDTEKQITTSRDEKCIKARRLLEVENIPGGFRKWQLPVALRCESQMFISVGPPGAKVPRHSHDEGAGIRSIVSGSIIYNGKRVDRRRLDVHTKRSRI